MDRFYRCVLRHTVVVAVTSGVILSLFAAALIFQPHIVILALRCVLAAVNIIAVLCIVFSQAWGKD